MIYIIKSLKTFKKQVEKLDEKTKRIIKEKIELIKLNPYRYKKLHSKLFSKVFRIRLTINNRDTRLIYVILEPNIILVCLLDRKDDYNDLEKYLNKVNQEF